MKIIKNYDDLGELDIDSKKIIYSRIKSKIHQKYMLELLPSGKSVWIDSGADNINPDIIAFEHQKWKGIFESTDIKYYRDFFSKTVHQSINKYIKPSSIVIYQSCEFRYVDEQTLVNNIIFLIGEYSFKLLIYIDTVFIDFNKLKYTPQQIIKNVGGKIKSKYKVHNIDNFKYILEIN